MKNPKKYSKGFTRVNTTERQRWITDKQTLIDDKQTQQIPVEPFVPYH